MFHLGEDLQQPVEVIRRVVFDHDLSLAILQHADLDLRTEELPQPILEA
jgi:hypothetical protein